MEKQPIVITHNLAADLRGALAAISPDRLFVLTDENTARHCWPLLAPAFALAQNSTSHLRFRPPLTHLCFHFPLPHPLPC
ncbi:MAG: hypothetical protein IKO85_07375 [Bacteroidaceae bacterium]|nr:hypothetical protein [Bacteroidaceae bacterium]